MAPERMSRRQFLASLGRAGLAGGLLAFLAERAAAGPAPDVVVVKGGRLRSMLRRGLEPLGGIRAFVKRGQRVVLKPNASFKNPAKWGNVTSPQLVREVAKLCLSAGAAEVLVLDNPLQGGRETMAATGLAEALARVPRTRLHAATARDDYRELPVPRGKALKKVAAAKALRDAVLINLPQAKHHVAASVSLGLKNLMGLVLDRHQFHHDFDLSQGIADLATALRPALTIVDATRIMVTKGPTGPGKVEKHDTIVIGTAPASVDAVTLGLTRWAHRRLRPQQVAHIRLASQAGLGSIDLDKLRVLRIEV